jgi:hypothetical protein
LLGIIQIGDGFKIDNSYNASYSRYLQMTEPELFGFFRCRMTHADTELIVNGESWNGFLGRKNKETTEQFQDASGDAVPSPETTQQFNNTGLWGSSPQR